MKLAQKADAPRPEKEQREKKDQQRLLPALPSLPGERWKGISFTDTVRCCPEESHRQRQKEGNGENIAAPGAWKIQLKNFAKTAGQTAADTGKAGEIAKKADEFVRRHKGDKDKENKPAGIKR